MNYETAWNKLVEELTADMNEGDPNAMGVLMKMRFIAEADGT